MSGKAPVQPAFFYVRHGETVWNRERRVQGRKDSPLTDKGRDQVRRIARHLAGMLGAPAPVIASPLGRTRTSAAIIAEELGLKPEAIRHDPLLVEASWGAWDGLTAAEIEARDPQHWQRCIDDGWSTSPPGGEGRAAMLDRARRWLDGLARAPGGPMPIVVGHGGFGRAVRCAWLGLPAGAMMAMSEPQDAFLAFADGAVRTITPEGDA